MLRKLFTSVLEVIEIAFITLGFVFLTRFFIVQPFLVSGGSMSPYMSHGDYLLIDELTYRFRDPQRGEVNVFRYPNNPSTYFIKRVIGLPGERVQIREGEVRIFNNEYPDGYVLSETYLPVGTVTSGNVDLALQEGEYFFMGDNRPYSFDSRSWGVVKKDDIIGIARVRLYPLRHAAAFSTPEYER